MPEPAPLPDQNGRAFSRDELAIVRRAYARQMLAILGVDNSPIEAAYAAVPREAFLGRRRAPRRRRSPATGPCPAGTRLCFIRISSSRSIWRAASTIAAPRCTPSSSRPSARSPASISSMSAPATIARSWPSWSVRPAESRRSSLTPPGRAGQDLPFRSRQCPRRPWRGRAVARDRDRWRLCQFRRFSPCGSLDRRPVSGRASRIPARRARPPAGEFRRPAQRPRRGAQDRTARRRLCGAGGQHSLFCLRRGRIRG